MAELLLAVFVIGAIASARARHDPHRQHGVAPSLVAQRRAIVVLAILGALVLISLTL